MFAPQFRPTISNTNPKNNLTNHDLLELCTQCLYLIHDLAITTLLANPAGFSLYVSLRLNRELVLHVQLMIRGLAPKIIRDKSCTKQTCPLSRFNARRRKTVVRISRWMSGASETLPRDIVQSMYCDRYIKVWPVPTSGTSSPLAVYLSLPLLSSTTQLSAQPLHPSTLLLANEYPIHHFAKMISTTFAPSTMESS